MDKLDLWVDDVREPPSEYWIWLRSVHSAVEFIDANFDKIRVISLDHDAGDYASAGGDYIKILEHLEAKSKIHGINIPFYFNIHSMNPVGVQNMKAIVHHNHWTLGGFFHNCAVEPLEREQRCEKCSHEVACLMNSTLHPLGKCRRYHRDAPDGGYYG